MNKRIDALKKAGAKDRLTRECQDRLWQARQSCEDAREGGLKNFRESLKKARALFAEAEELDC